MEQPASPPLFDALNLLEGVDFGVGDPVRFKPDHALCPFQLLIKERVARYGDQIPGARFPTLPQEA